MTPKSMKQIAYILIILFIITISYPHIKDRFYSASYTEIALLGPTGNIGQYPDEIKVGQEYPISVLIKNHEKQTTLYKIDVKLVDDKQDTPPFQSEIIYSYVTIVEKDQTNSHPIRLIFEEQFTGRIVAEMYVFNIDTKEYIYHDRWVTIWIKIKE